MDLRTWAKGLLSAVIGGVANSVVLMIADPKTFNFQNGIGNLGTVAVTSAIVSAGMYLKQSPLPGCGSSKQTPPTGY